MLEALESRVLLTALPGNFHFNFGMPIWGGMTVPVATAVAPASCSGAVQVFNSTTISGWAYSAANSGEPVNVVITIDGVATTITANGDRPDLVKKLGSANHGFSYSVPGLATGKHTITIDVVDPVSGATKRIKSGTITIAPPTGSATISKTAISGYAFSASNQGEPVTVIVTINGVAMTIQADEQRPDLAKKLGSTNHGFTYALPALPTGTNTVTVDIVDPSTGQLKRILSSTIKVGPPTGQVSTFSATTISGWAINPASGAAPMNVVITINGVATTITAEQYVASLDKTYGTCYHGFTFTVPTLPPGNSTVTVDLVDPCTGQTVRLRSGVLTNPPPQGKVDTATATEIAGYATDTGMTGPLTVRVDVNGVAGEPFVANDSRKVVNGMSVGFDVTGDFAGKVVEVYAYDAQSNTPVLIWTNNHPPKGAVTSGSGTTVSGWAVDPDDMNTPVQVQVFIDGQWLATTTANISRPDVQAKAGAINVGFSVDIPGLRPGTHTITVYAIDGQANSQAAVLIGTYKVTNTPPVGKVETLNTSVVSGYAYDPDLGNLPATVNVYVDCEFFARVLANQPNATAPGHGFSVDLSSLPPGSHAIMVTVMDDRVSDQQEVVFFDDFLNNQVPIGTIESVTGTTITGWAYDPDAATSPAEIDIYVDGTYLKTVLANVDRPDLATTLGDAGTQHGFEISLPALSFGTHKIAIYAAESQGNVAELIGVATVTNNRPIGVFESATSTAITGWAADPDISTASLTIVVYVNGVQTATGTADLTRNDLLTSIGSTQHGFSIPVSLPTGVNKVDVYAVDPNNGLISLIGTRTVTC